MKAITIIFLMFFCNTIVAQTNSVNQKVQIVEVSCGQCKFGKTDKYGCDLAVRINGESYYIEGTHIDAHGDSHAQDGFCETIRKAEVIGEIKENKFVITYFKLLPIDKK